MRESLSERASQRELLRELLRASALESFSKVRATM
jgi:hypothetical protein